MTPAEILSRAADLLEARQGLAAQVFAAIDSAVAESKRGADTASTGISASVIREVWPRIGGPSLGSLGTWLRDPDRTLPQVLAMLRGQDWRSA
jgi:hypothetical protein